MNFRDTDLIKKKINLSLTEAKEQCIYKRSDHSGTITILFAHEVNKLSLFDYPAQRETTALLPRTKLLITECRAITTHDVAFKNNSSNIGPYHRADERIYLYI